MRTRAYYSPNIGFRDEPEPHPTPWTVQRDVVETAVDVYREFGR